MSNYDIMYQEALADVDAGLAVLVFVEVGDHQFEVVKYLSGFSIGKILK